MSQFIEINLRNFLPLIENFSHSLLKQNIVT